MAEERQATPEEMMQKMVQDTVSKEIGSRLGGGLATMPEPPKLTASQQQLQRVRMVLEASQSTIYMSPDMGDEEFFEELRKAAIRRIATIISEA